HGDESARIALLTSSRTGLPTASAEDRRSSATLDDRPSATRDTAGSHTACPPDTNVPRAMVAMTAIPTTQTIIDVANEGFWRATMAKAANPASGRSRLPYQRASRMPT